MLSGVGQIKVYGANMFCPVCKTEYRDGFYTCSDCSSPLVDKLRPREEPNKGFNKAELNVLKHLKSYRYFSIVCMVAFTIGILLAIYFLFFPASTYESRHINIIRLNGLIVMQGLSFYLHTCIRTIEKLQFNHKAKLGLTGDDNIV